MKNSRKKGLNTPEEIMKAAAAFQRSRILLTAFDLDLFSVIGKGSRTSEEAAMTIGADHRAVDRLLNALTALGLLRKEGGRFFNGEAASRFLVKGGPEYMAALGHTSFLYHSWGTLTESVRAGTSAWDRSRDEWNDDNRRAFIAAMHYRAMKTAPRDIALIDLKDVQRVLDVGGGSGVYSIAFARAREGLEALVLDLPHITKLTQEYIAAEGMENRIETRDGDYLDADFGSGFDLVFLSAIVHINSHEQNRLLAVKSFNALNPGGRIVINDFIMDEDRTFPVRGAVFALNMLVNTECGDTYTEGEVGAWLTDAGFIGIERVDTGPETAFVIGRKP